MMLNSEVSRLAELQFCCAPGFSLAQVVGEADRTISRLYGPSRLLSWDCDDVAILDMPGLRLLLALTEPEGSFDCYRFFVGTGPSPLVQAAARRRPNARLVCDTILHRVSERFAPDALHLHVLRGILTAESCDPFLLDPGDGKHPAPWRPAMCNAAPDDLRDMRSRIYPAGPGLALGQTASRLATQLVEIGETILSLPSALGSYLAARTEGLPQDPR